MHLSALQTSNPSSGPAITPPPSSERRLSQAVFAAEASLVTTAPGTSAKVGDKILGFELVEELGQGAFARVFLGKQESLAQRTVALKVTLRPTREAERLARLQHTHIVPVYSVHSGAGVQVICMPYLGRRTIADLIRGFRNDLTLLGLNSRKHSGTRAAKTTTTPESRAVPKPTAPSGQYPRQVCLVDGELLPDLIGKPIEVLKVLGQLAAGLAHAHERGILHLDLKPANVLLADTGEPMLLDFNLSFDVSSPDRELIGGTVPYMSVEQLEDLRTRGRGRVDARTDLYSLGVLAFEMLTGTVPFPASFLADIDGLIATRQKGPPSIRALNPTVSPAVESIVHKLLAADPEHRYQTADELRTDVELQLKDQPLKYAPETSLLERLGKWHRRNPRLPGRLLAGFFLALALALGGVAYSHAEANADASAVKQFNESRAALARLRLDLVLPCDPESRKRGIADTTSLLASYGLPENPDWRKSDAVRRLSEQERTDLEGDLRELSLLLAHAHWLEADGRPEPERRDIIAAALKLNRAARTCFPADSTPALLEHQSADWSQILGETVEPAPRRNADRKPDARELFLDAATDISSGRYASAKDSLLQIIEVQPAHAAAVFCLGYCRQQTGELERSLERFDSARALLPTDPRPAYQLGVVYGLLHKPELAEKEFTRAIALNPKYGQAYRNRAVARTKLGQYREAEEDLTVALAEGASAIQIHLLRAIVREKLGDAKGAQTNREAASTLTPKLEMDYLVRGLSRFEKDPPGAIADFKTAAAINPRSLPALMNQANVLDSQLNDLAGALAMTTRAAALCPEYAPALIGRAVMLARVGQREEAIKEANKALAISEDHTISYRAACVYSLASAKHPEDRTKAFEYLRLAVRKGYKDLAEIKKDKDLAPIRDSQEFRAIVQAIVALK